MIVFCLRRINTTFDGLHEAQFAGLARDRQSCEAPGRRYSDVTPQQLLALMNLSALELSREKPVTLNAASAAEEANDMVRLACAQNTQSAGPEKVTDSTGCRHVMKK